MTSFSHAELELLWINAGGDEFAADTAAAIAQGESGGCQYAKHGPRDDRPVKQCSFVFSTGEDSYGLWQINRDAHPQFTPRELYTAAGNAKAAVEVAGTPPGFSPWTIYKNGAYKQYLTGALPPSPGPATTGAHAPSPVGGPSLEGWRDFNRALSHGLPTALHHSQQLRAAALRKLR